MEGLKAMLLQQKISREGFNVPIHPDDFYKVFVAAYNAEVEYRGSQAVQDDENGTKYILWDISLILTSTGRKKNGLMLNGLYGNGKTTTVLALKATLNFLRDKGYVDGDRLGVRIIDAKQLAILAPNPNAMTELAKTECALCIEDMGREASEVMNYGNILSPVADIVEQRYADQLFTIITTNLTPEQVKERYGGRVADRFREMLEVITFRHASYR